jgi:hypothetical protein
LGVTLLRPEVQAALWRWREVIWAGAVAAFGLWLLGLGGWVLGPLGALVIALALGLGVQALRRVRFAQRGDAPGVVQVDEGQISYMGPTVGGFVSLPELVELRLVTMRGRRLWRLKQADGQALLIPVEAEGAVALFDAFASLPGMDSGALVAALEQPQPGGPALVVDTRMQLVWARAGRGVVGT